MEFDINRENTSPRRYVQFPLFLLHDILTDKNETINKILNYGIYHYAMAIEYDLNNVARQICYHNYRRSLDKDIIAQLNKYDFEFFGNDEEYNGFVGANFIPEDEMIELLELFESDPLLKATCIEYYRINQAFKLLNLTGDASTIKATVKGIKSQIKPRQVFPMIGTHLLFNYRDSDKSEYDIIQLMAYVSISSIIGVKPFAKTNKQFILKRMFGENSADDARDKYEKRYHWEKLIFKLQTNWKVNIYSNRTRGIWVSIGKKYPLPILIEHAEKVKAKNSIKNFKKWKQQIIDTAIQGTIKQPLDNDSTTS